MNTLANLQASSWSQSGTKVVRAAAALIAAFAMSCGFGEPDFDCLSGDCENGTGAKLYSDGTRYTGQFQDGRNHGVGRFESPDGHLYEGEWERGQKQGSGRYTYPGGTLYEGEFRANVKHGYGSFTWGDGTKYTGDWRDGEPHGNGKVTLADGTVMEGVYRQGVVQSGAGIYIYDDGSRYIGQWQDGRREGVGVLLNDHGGLIWAGRWEDDERVEAADFMDSQSGGAGDADRNAEDGPLSLIRDDRSIVRSACAVIRERVA